MPTFNMTREMAEEYHRATDGGAHPPNIAIGIDAARGPSYMVLVVVQKCALCDAAIDLSHCTPDTYGPTMTAHHAVCPRRPIEVGETVRIMRTTSTRMHGSRGVVVEIDQLDDHMPYRVKVDGEDYDGWWCHEVERIPRPAEAQAAVPHLEHRCQGSLPTGGQCRARTTATNVRLGEWQCPDCVAREVAARAAPLPAPALVDGLDREVCLARWMENRLAVEGGSAPRVEMTRMQRDVARAMWLARYGAKRGDELRAKVAAGREAERNRVRVDIQDMED